ncbi:hypothetical protein HBA54_16410 [Pelagibius litoralis]|uniref:Uncharacterized protein n=1 Tax=Pelagibius litoralis TaxID=374515 RepID=A0A967EZC1_9PROT|nr:hypothetical protein [Pelagibius litoralis]NIA70191.1 hypothetical protein [Pelagibius litoralis]
MRASRKAFIPAALAAVLLTGGLVIFPCSAVLADEPKGEETPGYLAREGIEQMMRAMRLLVDSIPQYELPEMLDNGDIIIRRKDPQKPRRPEEPEVDETAT